MRYFHSFTLSIFLLAAAQTAKGGYVGEGCGNIICEPGEVCEITKDPKTGKVTEYACVNHAPPTRSAPSADNSAQSAGSSQCASRYNSLILSCQSSIEEARNSCDEKQDSGMNSVSDTASEITVLMGQMAASSMAAACSKMADLTQAANAALVAYQLSCSNSISSCKSACAEVVRFAQQNSECFQSEALAEWQPGPSISSGDLAGRRISSAEESLKQCDSFRTNVQQAQQAVQNYQATAANASQCVNQSSGVSPFQSFCASNPNFTGCNSGPVDCTKPEHANSNKVCICIRNPQDAQCSSANKVGGGIGATTGSADSSSRLANKASANLGGGDIPGLPGIEQGNPGSLGGGEAADGQQGGGASLGGGGGGGGAPPSSGGGSQASAPTEGSSGGFYGGSGNRFGGGGSSGSGGGGGYMGTSGQGGAVAGTPDLKRFLPGGQFDPKRGISGLNGPDGITGPHSNIWQKIQNRYQVMKPSLLP